MAATELTIAASEAEMAVACFIPCAPGEIYLRAARIKFSAMSRKKMPRMLST
jgi:hypothetical protein